MQSSCAIPVSEAVERAKLHIDENYATIQSVRDVADSIGENYNNLRAKFRREMGVSLDEYLIDARVRAAQGLLLETDLFVKEICRHVGYKDEAYMGKVFREHCGMTMRVWKYREKMLRSVKKVLRRFKNYV